MIYNEEYQRIEKFLTDYIQANIKEKPNFHFHVAIRDTLPEQYREYPPKIRVGIRSAKVNKVAQGLIKDFFKDTFNLSTPVLERDYGSSGKEVLYEIVYEVSEELFDQMKILSIM